MSKPEIIRCLKRYIAREIYTALLDPQPSSVPAITSTAPRFDRDLITATRSSEQPGKLETTVDR
jgi:hypothetical protein